MCCFSSAVRHVSETQIFARPSGNSQILVYSMRIQAEQEVAMILPLPVPPNSAESAVRFINLEAYPQFFTDLGALFPAMVALGRGPVDGGISRAPLAVQDVGLFEASFVPTIADFARLDPRFRLPETAWHALPQYADWGFAVFKLKQPGSAPASAGVARRFLQKLFPSQTESEVPAGADAFHEPHRIHPMAFEFPRRNPTELFFPTVHIHDGQVHETAEFDHELYFQSERKPAAMNVPGSDSRELLKRWSSLEMYLQGRLRASSGPIERHVDLERAAGTVRPAIPIYQWTLEGTLPNQDSTLEL
jgi:hypothetical protein